MILACVSSWGQAAIDDPSGGVRLVVRDELWRALRIPAMIRKVDSDLRLSRSQGTIQVLATHRLADFEAVGAAGSAEVAIASNLLASCDVRICLRQDTAPLAMTREAIGLTDTEAAQIASWTGEHLGRALWKIGRTSSHIVQTVLHPLERDLYWTNQKILGTTAGFSNPEDPDGAEPVAQQRMTRQDAGTSGSPTGDGPVTTPAGTLAGTEA